jgi:hypothetical protein
MASRAASVSTTIDVLGVLDVFPMPSVRSLLDDRAPENAAFTRTWSRSSLLTLGIASRSKDWEALPDGATRESQQGRADGSRAWRARRRPSGAPALVSRPRTRQPQLLRHRRTHGTHRQNRLRPPRRPAQERTHLQPSRHPARLHSPPIRDLHPTDPPIRRHTTTPTRTTTPQELSSGRSWVRSSEYVASLRRTPNASAPRGSNSPTAGGVGASRPPTGLRPIASSDGHLPRGHLERTRGVEPPTRANGENDRRRVPCRRESRRACLA